MDWVRFRDIGEMVVPIPHAEGLEFATQVACLTQPRRRRSKEPIEHADAAEIYEDRLYIK